MPNYSLGIDIGGTFTDIVVHDHDDGRQWSMKVLTTHDDPARAVGAGVVALLGEDGLTGPGQAYTQTSGGRPSAPDVSRCEGSQEVPMNRLVRVALVLAATLSVTMPAQAAEDVRGWRNTTWKMSESEVKRSVGALGLVVTPAPASPALPGAVPFTTKVDIDGSEYDVAFYFLDDSRHLGRVQVGGQDAPREDALRRHASLLRTLTERLGAPSETDSRGSLLSMTRWTFKTTTIALNMYTDTGARGRLTQVGVTYSPTAQGAEDREKVLGFGLLQLLGGFWKR